MKIIVVCYANYCRSPVAAFLLNKRFGKEFQVNSAGIIDFNKVGMDPRSYKYIKDCFQETLIHKPTKINKNHLIESDIIFAIDMEVFIALKNKYPKYAKKIRLFANKNNRVIIRDPYNFDDQTYHKIMKRIEDVSKHIEI